MKNPTVKDMIRTYLKKNGYSGLYEDNDGCGCSIEDLMPCDSMIINCKAGYRVKCNKLCYHEPSDFHTQSTKRR